MSSDTAAVVAVEDRHVARQVVEKLESVVGRGEQLPLHAPEFAGSEWEYVKQCIDTGWVSSVGAFVDRFEEDLAKATGVRRAVATVNGTAALHVGLRLLGVGIGDEVLVPALTFVATANAVSYCGASPHFIDSCTETLGVDPAKLEEYLVRETILKAGTLYNRKTKRPIRAAVVMHTFGHPAALDELVTVCDRFGLPLIEDAAESLGSFYKGVHTGNFGKCATLSFNGNKVITTGGGGAILTNDDALADLAKHLTTTAKLPHPWRYDHDTIGYNYRLPNINAALGCAQLEQLPGFLSRKRRLADRYEQALAQIPSVQFVKEPVHGKSNYWLNALLVPAADRDAVLELTNRLGIMTRPAWVNMHELRPYSECPRMDLSVAEELQRRLVTLPSSPRLVERA